ncbi:MAG: helix-turn-helix transcriptional regulator [Dehalococcoidia bacterium]
MRTATSTRSVTEADRRFWCIVRILRELAEISRAELSRRAGIQPGYLLHGEHGHRPTPTREIALSIADALNLEEAERNNLLLAGGLAPTQTFFRRLADEALDSDQEWWQVVERSTLPTDEFAAWFFDSISRELHRRRVTNFALDSSQS